MALDPSQLEHVHDYIQWLFPLPEPSRAQPQSPVMTDEDIEAFKLDLDLHKQVERACLLMLNWYMDSPHWVTPRNHNFLRITRIIRFLTLIGFDAEAAMFYGYALGCLRKHGLMDLEDLHKEGTVQWFWAEARNLVPAWL